MASLDKLRLDWLDKHIFTATPPCSLSVEVQANTPPKVTLNGTVLPTATTIRQALDKAKAVLP